MSPVAQQEPFQKDFLFEIEPMYDKISRNEYGKLEFNTLCFLNTFYRLNPVIHHDPRNNA
jgi:hypothetical protein